MSYCIILAIVSLSWVPVQGTQVSESGKTCFTWHEMSQGFVIYGYVL